ncbi:MAG: hypothetical protein ACFFBL_12065 [Promethearchaeota archaeon]
MHCICQLAREFIWTRDEMYHLVVVNIPAGTDERGVEPDKGLETSHPDIDSVLEMHIGTGDFSYRTRIADGSTEHLLMNLKWNQWKVALRIDNEEVKTFEPDELATYLILQVKMNQAMKRRFWALILLFAVISIPIVGLSIIVLGVGVTYDFEKFLIAGGVIAIFIPLACVLMSGVEKSVDRSLYQNRSNLIQVLQKMMDLKETPSQRSAIQDRIDRLQGYRIDTL